MSGKAHDIDSEILFQIMDGGSSGGFQISPREISFVSPTEQDLNSSLYSMSSLLTSSAPAGDPSSLQKSLSESVSTSCLDNNNPQPYQRADFNRICTGTNTAEIRTEIGVNKNLQYGTSAPRICSESTSKSFAAAVESIRSGVIGFNSRPNSGSISAAMDNRLCVDSAATAKVGKKRSRASRRAPTTVLTTDVSNFRAMVQEFTGIPTAPFSSAPFTRNGIDYLAVPRPAGLPGAPNLLLRPFLHCNSMPQISNYGRFPPPPNSTPPPPNLFAQSLMQAQHPRRGSIPFSGSYSFSNGPNGGLLIEELGLNTALPDVVLSDRRPSAHTQDDLTPRIQ